MTFKATKNKVADVDAGLAEAESISYDYQNCLIIV